MSGPSTVSHPWSAVSRGPNGKLNRTNDGQRQSKPSRKALNARALRRRKKVGLQVFKCTSYAEALIDHLVRLKLLRDDAVHRNEEIELALSRWINREIRK